MSISITRYVNVLSGLAASPAFTTRDLIGRFFTNNILISPLTFIEFSNITDVGTFFGTTSEEYNRAKFYFSWISKNFTQAESIQFARYAQGSNPPAIYSAKNNSTILSNWTSITSGSFGITIGSQSYTATSMDFSSAGSLAAVATIIQTKINGGSGTMFTDATVTYSNGGFILLGGTSVATAVGNISIQVAGGGTDITKLGLLGWFPAETFPNNIYSSATTGALWIYSTLGDELTTLLNYSVSQSNNFGSLAFLNNLFLTQANIVEIATWNFSENVSYLYSIPVSAANAATYAAALTNIGGCALTLGYYSLSYVGVVTDSSNSISGLTSVVGLAVGQPLDDGAVNIPAGAIITSISAGPAPYTITISAEATGNATEAINFYPWQFPEQLPMMIEASTDYTGVNTVQNYMFQQDNTGSLSPTVTTDSAANGYDTLFINYYGQTQDAGTVLSFYQRGVMQGQSIANNIDDMTAYVNEIWLRDAATVAIMNLLLALTQISANPQGRSQILTVLQDIVNQALLNGTISVGKTLSALQKVYITNTTNDPLAWYQVQNNGYWLDVEIVLVGSDYVAEYLLIYSKDDVIRLVEGTHTLI